MMLGDPYGALEQKEKMIMTKKNTKSNLDEPIIDIDEKPNLNIEAPEFDITTESFPPTKVDDSEKKSTSSLLSGDDLAEIKKQLMEQVVDELKDDRTRKIEEAKFRRETEDTEQKRYIEKMKQSPDPWVDIIGWVRTDEGVKVELEWNEAFVDYLRGNGIKGADDEQVVQKWVTLLLRDMADEMEERYGSDYE